MPLDSILLSATTPPDDLRRWLIAADFRVADHSLGATASPDFSSVAVAVIDVSESLSAATAQTRRWRIELGDVVVPIIWILPTASAELAAKGLDAGADACLARPLAEGEFLAQIRALTRTHAMASRLAGKVAEARLLGDQLQKAYAQIDREWELARRVQRSVLPQTFPEIGSARFAVCQRPRLRGGGDFYDVRRLDEDHIGFFVADVIGPGNVTGTLLGLHVQHAVRWKEITVASYRLIPPDELLANVNRDLLALRLDDPPLVAMLAGVLNVHTGSLVVARAGLPAPVYVPSVGEPEVWAVPGPFLGTAETTYQPQRATLSPGDKLLIGTDGTRPTGEAPLGLATKHRTLTGQAFVDAITRELLPQVEHPDDFTLMGIEILAERPV